MFSQLVASVTRLSNHELLGETQRLARREREATAALVAHLAEIEARGLHVREGFESLFCYCRTALGLGEHETYNRIQVARGPISRPQSASSRARSTPLRHSSKTWRNRSRPGILRSRRRRHHSHSSRC